MAAVHTHRLERPADRVSLRPVLPRPVSLRDSELRHRAGPAVTGGGAAASAHPRGDRGSRGDVRLRHRRRTVQVSLCHRRGAVANMGDVPDVVHGSGGNNRMKRVLVISPHPDDEAIGCGGTLRKHVVEDGAAVHVIFLTSGEKGGHGQAADQTPRLRERESSAAQRILGVQEIEFYREPDGGVRVYASVVKRLAEKLRKWRPDVVYAPHDDEMHPDHRAAGRLVRAALKGASRWPAVLTYEVWTPLQRMDEIIDITPYANVKRRAIRAYRSQCAEIGRA